MVDVSEVLVAPAVVNALMVSVPAVQTPAYCQVVETVPPALTKDRNALLAVVKPGIAIVLVPAVNVV